MIFGKNTKGNQFQIGEKRLVFFAQNSAAENVESKDWLPDEYAIGQNVLQNHVSEIDDQIRKRETRSKTRKVLAKLTGRGKTTTEDLKLKKVACETYIESAKAPVENQRNFDTALRDIDEFNENIDLLRGSNINQVRIDDLLNSDLHVFFSSKLQRQLEASRGAMTLHEKATNLLRSLGTDHPELTKQATAEWGEREEALNGEYEKVSQGETIDLNKAREIKADLKGKTNWINRRVAELQAEAKLKEENADNARFVYTKEAAGLNDDVIHLIQKQVKEGGKSRLHSLTEQIEGESIRSVDKMLGYEQRLELTNLLLEAREIKREQIKAYLTQQFKKVEQKFEALKKRDVKVISLDQVRGIDQKIKAYQSGVLTNPDALKVDRETISQYLVKLEHIERNLDKTSRELEIPESLQQNPDSMKAEVEAKFAAIKRAAASYTPERVKQLLEAHDAKEKGRIESLNPNEKKKSFNKFGKSKVYLKERQAILNLSSSDSALTGQITEVENLLGDLDQMSPEELIDMKVSLDQLHERLLPFSGEKMDQTLGEAPKTEAYLASEVLSLIAGESDPEKIQQILEEKLGSKHFELIGDSQFESHTDTDGVTRNLKEFTSGAMVFYERGDDWKIIINQDGLKNDKSFKDQLTHELLHLQFEKNEELKAEWLRLFTQNSEWPTIKQAYIDTFPDKNPPDGSEWKDEDILSEIYAMQNDVFGKSEKFQNLQKAITAAGITTTAMGLPKGSVRGYEGGDSASDVMGGMPSKGDGEDNEEIVETGSAEEYKKNIEENDREIKRMIKSEYMGMIPGGKALLELMKDFNDDTAELNDYLAEEPSAYLTEKVKERIKKVKDDLKDLNQQMAEVGENMPNNRINPIRDMWNRSAFLSIDSFIQMGVDIKEWMERRHKRKTAEHAARIGSSLFDKMPIPVFGEFGTEAEARSEKAQQEEVDEWKNRLTNKDAWELHDLIKKMATELDPNRDQLKAILRILAEKGRIDWRDEHLWTVLNKLQSAAQLVPGDETLLKNPTMLRQNLHQAIGEIWDYDEFLELDRNNESNYDGGKQKYMAICDKIQDQLTDRLNQLLKKHRDGEKVDPQEYEAILEYSIKNGKSYAENVLFHLMAGMAEGLLNADRGLVLDKYLNNWPACQWIYSKAPPLTRKDYIRVAKEEFGESYKAGVVKMDFKDFYWQEVQNDSMTIQRVRKSVSERVWDHDWGRSIACMGDANTAKRFLSGRSGQQQVADTGVENAYVGALQWLEHNAKAPKSTARKDFARQVAWISMADGVIDWVAYNRGSSDIYTRGNASIMNAVAREAPVGSHGTETTGEHRDRIRTFLDFFDPQFYEMLRDAKAAGENKDAHGVAIRDYLLSNPRYANTPGLAEDLGTITEIDHVFDKMDAITMAMVNTAPESTFQAALQYLRDNTGKEEG